MVNRIFAPAQEHIARELYRGSYRSRSPERGVLGGSWRYIAGGLYRGSYRSRGTERTGPRRQLAVYSRGGFAEEATEAEARRGRSREAAVGI